jgi:hypothetical protein
MIFSQLWKETKMNDSRKLEDFVAELLVHVPELRSVYDEHINDNDELLPHMFLGDVTRYVVRQVEDNAIDTSQSVSRILCLFENEIVNANEDIQELISVSFLENLCGHEDIVTRLGSLMGPNLRKELENF